MALFRAQQEVAFPVPGHRPVGGLGRPLGDVDRSAELTLAVVGGQPARAAAGPAAAQVAGQFLAQRPPGLHEHRSYGCHADPAALRDEPARPTVWMPSRRGSCRSGRRGSAPRSALQGRRRAQASVGDGPMSTPLASSIQLLARPNSSTSVSPALATASAGTCRASVSTSRISLSKSVAARPGWPRPCTVTASPASRSSRSGSGRPPAPAACSARPSIAAAALHRQLHLQLPCCSARRYAGQDRAPSRPPARRCPRQSRPVPAYAGTSAPAHRARRRRPAPSGSR